VTKEEIKEKLAAMKKQKEMIRDMQGILCTGRYRPFALQQEEYRKIKIREKRQTRPKDRRQPKKKD